MLTIRPLSLSLTCGLTLSSGICALAQTPPDYGIDFVTVSDPGNPACMLTGPGGGGYTLGRGSVSYEYRIGRTEINTTQWLSFVNTFSTLGGQWTDFGRPVFWGAEADPTYVGPGNRYRLRAEPSAGAWPVGGVSWRTAAMYSNWLTNGQATGTWALQNGAYDTSTFTTNPDQTFNDQRAHNPGAAFWIPTLDEWLKAVHYDPNRFGPGQGGWWMYSDRSDSPYIYGPPPGGQANAGFTLPNFGEWQIPLGAYPAAASPWGLLDTAGGASEWLEDALGQGPLPVYRGVDGSSASMDPYLSAFEDQAVWFFGDPPGVQLGGYGLRIASTVPAPGTLALLLVSCSCAARRHRKGEPCVALCSGPSPCSSRACPSRRHRPRT